MFNIIPQGFNELGQIVGVDNTVVNSIEERVSRVYSIVEVTQDRTIDLTISCEKTGREIYKVAPDVFRLMEITHGKEKARQVLRTQQLHKVHPLWLDTSPAALSNLMIYDPYGYYVYCTGLAIAGFRKLPDPGIVGQVEQYEAFSAQMTAEKAVLWQAIQHIPMREIVKTNEILRRFLSCFNAHSIRQQWGYVSNTLETKLWKECKISAMTPEVLISAVRVIIKNFFGIALINANQQADKRRKEEGLKKRCLSGLSRETISEFQAIMRRTQNISRQKILGKIGFEDKLEYEIFALLDYKEPETVQAELKSYSHKAPKAQNTAKHLVLVPEADKHNAVKSSRPEKGVKVQFTFGNGEMK